MSENPADTAPTIPLPYAWLLTPTPTVGAPRYASCNFGLYEEPCVTACCWRPLVASARYVSTMLVDAASTGTSTPAAGRPCCACAAPSDRVTASGRATATASGRAAVSSRAAVSDRAVGLGRGAVSGRAAP